MNALINLKDCREYMIINLNNKKHQVKLAGTIADPYFCGRDVCEILEYKDIQNALYKHVKDKYKKDLKTLHDDVHGNGTTRLGIIHSKKLTYNEGKAVYINTLGLKSLLQKNRVAPPDHIKVFIDHPFIKQIGVDLNLVQMYKEQECIGAIVKTLAHMKTYTQFNVGQYRQYRLDLYIPQYNLAIECDEFNHSNRDPVYEKEREAFVKKELNCEFIRFNPDNQNFSTYEVIGKIIKYIEMTNKETRDREIETRDREIETKDREIRKLKVEVDNLTEQLGDFLFVREKDEGPDSI